MLVPDVNDVAGAMARNVANLQPETGCLDHIPLADRPVGRRTYDVEARQAAHIQSWVGEHRHIDFADHQWSVRKRLLYHRVAANVVPVSVRVQNHRYLE